MTSYPPLIVHTLLEMAAYTVGAQLYFRERRRLALPALADGDRNLWIIVAAALGAAFGAKIAFWAEDPGVAFLHFPDWRQLLAGKSIVGGLLGGLVGVETCKRLLGRRDSTGDAFVLPLAAGMVIGRIGCFAAGLADHTYGDPSALPWAVDFGDGIPRHPTQIYEIVFLVAWTALLLRRRAGLGAAGDAFKLYLAGYLAFRLVIDTIKPVPHAYWLGLSGIQWLCVIGLAYYSRHLPRLTRELAWDTK
jgi:phosphatidylglycerol---prolipoprotein diacylglyceryl transferase